MIKSALKSMTLGERLPVKIKRNSIEWGKIRAYHPDLLYKKYGISFIQSNKVKIVGENFDHTVFKMSYFYYELPSSLSDEEVNALEENSAQTFIKFKDEKQKEYLLTISGEHIGNADFREICVKLFKYDKNMLKLIFNKTETYFVDPGIESNYFSEKLKFFFYKYFSGDERYK